MARPSERLIRAAEEYERTFERPIPEPFGASDDQLAEVLEQAIRRGEPVPDDYDWWATLPPGADA